MINTSYRPTLRVEAGAERLLPPVIGKEIMAPTTIFGRPGQKSLKQSTIFLLA